MLSSHEKQRAMPKEVPPISWPCPIPVPALADESWFFTAHHGCCAPLARTWSGAGHVTYFWSVAHKEIYKRPSWKLSLPHTWRSPFCTCSLHSHLRWCLRKTWCLKLRQPCCNRESHGQNSKDGRTERHAEYGSWVISKRWRASVFSKYIISSDGFNPSQDVQSTMFYA